MVYPVDYLENAIPRDHPNHRIYIKLCKKLLTSGDDWSHLVNDCLFNHPRRVALDLFNKVLSIHNEQAQIYQDQLGADPNGDPTNMAMNAERLAYNQE